MVGNDWGPGATGGSGSGDYVPEEAARAGFGDNDGPTPAREPRTGSGPMSPVPVGSGRIWPVALGLSLFLVVCVNLAFIYIAVSGADEVVPSYVEEER
ncbi:MAG: hypothetical protein P8188_05810 [Gemmatimonadota bacterium]